MVKILNFNIFGGFQKNEYFLGMTILRIFFGGLHKFGLFLGFIYMHYRVFLYSQGTEWGIFLGVAKISNIFWGA